MPASSERFIEKARGLPADEVFLDLEDAYDHATTVDQRGAVMLGEEMIDEASRKMAEVIVARGNAADYAKIGKAPE